MSRPELDMLLLPRPRFYLFTESTCPGNHGTMQGKAFIGHLYYHKSAKVFQVYECPLCGKRAVIEYGPHQIDIDHPKYARGGVFTIDWLDRQEKLNAKAKK